MDSSLYSKASTFYDIDDIPLIDDEVIEEICSINYKNNQATETKGKNTKNGSRKYSEKRFVVTKLEDNVLNLKNNIDIENLEKGNFDIMKDSLLKMNSNNISPLLNDFVTDDSNNSEECNDDIDKPYEFQLFKKKILVRNPWVLFKKDFIRRRGVEEKQFGLEVVRACLPQLILIVTLLFYIAFGVYVFQNYDEKITNEETRNVVLFVFTTIATIGYGNLSPSSQSMKIFCTIYSYLGIPLMFSVFRNIGESCAKFIWLLRASLSTDPNYKPKCIVSLPIQVIMIFLLLHTALGLFLFHYWIDTINYVDAVYMSFISITTIGYGDITPKPTTDLQTFIVLIYLSIGISIMSMMISTLSEMMKIVHVVGRSPAKAKDALIYINGEHITVGTLLQMIAKQFGVHPRELQSVIKNLDHIITAALEEEKRKEKKQRRRRFSLPHFDKNKRQKSQSIESEETQFDSLNFITLTSSNYNPQTCKYIQALGQLNHITQQSDKSRNNTIVLQKNFNSMAKRRNSYHNITKTKYKDDPVSVKLFNE
uniref:Ion_trans_2 domain-containing protein n=1 Tax=Parastrongyloides trichosuri TaxID=131310 RepID=A0A0N4ZUH7_PARTI